MAGHGKQLIFLSHSGFQKPFAEKLYLELLHVNHHVFFDQDPDSLPKGTAFPQRIVEAARQCKVGVVVLSHEYIESKWPMLELEQLVFHSAAKIYPLFYELTPGDLTREENLLRWQTKWDAIAPSLFTSSQCQEERNIDISMWPRALKTLRFLSGEVFMPRTSEHAYIQNIVSNICKMLPLPRVMLDDTLIKGKEHLAQEIAARFKLVEELSQDAQVSVLGLFGVAGSGKSTLCKNMAEFYNAEYTGRSWCLELPSADRAEGKIVEELRKEKIVEDLRKALRILTQTRDDEGLMHITDVDQAIGLLKQRVHKHTVFLAVDNVSDNTFEIASKLILGIKFGQGSKLLVTSQSRQLLNALLPPCGPQYRCSVGSVPSISESEAMEALIAYGGHNLACMPSRGEMLNDVVSWCFFGGLCNPLLLKAMGAKLRAMAGGMSNEKAWRNYISKLLDCPIHADYELEKAVVSILKKSFQDIAPTLQNIFLDLLFFGLFISSNAITTELCEGLCLLYEGYTPEDMRYQLIKLEYHGLLELEANAIRVHDLYRCVAEGEALVSGRYLSEASSIAKMDCRRLERIRMAGWQPKDEQKLILSSLKHCSQAKLLQLCFLFYDIPRDLTLEGMASLCILEIETAPYLEEVMGWNQAPNLVSVKLLDCPGLKSIGDMGCLSKLQELLIYGANIDLQDVGRCLGLKKLELGCNEQLKNLSFVEALQKLQKLVIESCPNLEDLSSITTLAALQELRLRLCGNLEEFPYIRLSNLRILVLSSCDELGVVHGNVFALTSLEELQLHGCSLINGIPSLKNLDKLNTLKLSLENCQSLEGIEGLTSCEVLTLSFFSNLKGILDVTNLTKLKTLKLYKCQALEGIKGVSALMSMEMLEISFCENLECFSNFELSLCNDLKVILDVKNLAKLHTLKLSLNICWTLEGIEGLISLEVLSLSFCSGLKGMLDLTNLTKLKTLKLYKCQALEVIKGLNSLVRLETLELSFCNNLKGIPDLKNLVKLRSLKLSHCWAFDQPFGQHVEEIGDASSLEHVLKLDVCTPLQSIPDLKNLVKLHTLKLDECPALQEIQGVTALVSLEVLEVISCLSLKYIPDMAKLTKLNNLKIYSCDDLEEIEGVTSIMSLEVLEVMSCSSLRRIPDLGDLTKLDTLRIGRCNNLEEIQGVSALVQVLEVVQCNMLKRMPDLANLTKLITLRILCHALEEIQGVSVLVGLEVLEIECCSRLKHIPDLANLTKLNTLRVYNFHELEEIAGVTALVNLEVLEVECCSSLKCIPDLVNLTKLNSLIIFDCYALEDIEGVTALMNLEVLEVMFCSCLKRIPDLANLTKLNTLRISSCG